MNSELVLDEDLKKKKSELYSNVFLGGLLFQYLNEFLENNILGKSQY